MSDGSAEFHVMMEGVDEISAPANSADASLALIVEQLKQLNQSADVTNYQLGATGDQLEKTSEKSQSAGLSMSELNQGMEVINKTLAYAQQAYDATIGKSQSYGESVRDLMAITGESAQATSDLIQVADDYQITTDDLTASMRILTKNGLVPNKETLVDLAEQYQAIQDPLEKNEFLVKNLGRASSNYTNFLSQNTDELRKSFDAQRESLEWGEKEQKQAEQLRLSQDALSDSYEHLSIRIGTYLTPKVQAWVDLLNKAASGQVDWGKAFQDAYTGQSLGIFSAYGDQFNANAVATDGLTKAQLENKQSAADLEEKLKADEEAAKALSQTYQTIFSLEQSIQSQTDSYASSVANLTTKQSELQAKVAETNPWEVDKIAGYKSELDKIPPQLDALAAKNEEAMNKMIFSNIMAKDSVDGISAAEFARDQALGVSLGLFTEDAANRAIAINTLATAFHDGAISVDELQAKLASGTLGTPPEAITSSWSGLQDRIKESTGTTAIKIDEGITKVENYADVTKNKTDSVAEGWQTAASAIEGSVNDGISNIQRYIDALNTIPATVNTTLTQTTAGGESGGIESFGTKSGGGQSIIYNLYGPISIGADHSLTPMLVVG